MLEQFLKSILSYFCTFHKMNAYIQNMPKDVKYPCYLVNKCDINTTSLNSVYFINTISPYIRITGRDEVELKNVAFDLVNQIFQNHRKIPILDIRGLETGRYIRLEDIEATEIIVDENEVYCMEINFSFDTTHIVNIKEFDLLAKVFYNTKNSII